MNNKAERRELKRRSKFKKSIKHGIGKRKQVSGISKARKDILKGKLKIVYFKS